MTHKQRCIANAMEYLQARGLEMVFDSSIFQYFYRKNNGYTANAYTLGLAAADMMILNYNPQNFNCDESGNED